MGSRNATGSPGKQASRSAHSTHRSYHTSVPQRGRRSTQDGHWHDQGRHQGFGHQQDPTGRWPGQTGCTRCRGQRQRFADQSVRQIIVRGTGLRYQAPAQSCQEQGRQRRENAAHNVACRSSVYPGRLSAGARRSRCCSPSANRRGTSIRIVSVKRVFALCSSLDNNCVPWGGIS